MSKNWTVTSRQCEDGVRQVIGSDIRATPGVGVLEGTVLGGSVTLVSSRNIANLDVAAPEDGRTPGRFVRQVAYATHC